MSAPRTYRLYHRILVHILEISKKANLVLEFMGILFKFRISCTVFFVLKAYGKGISSLTFFFSENNLRNLYAGAFVQLTVGLIGHADM